MKPPIFTVEDFDVVAFDSVEAAEAYEEAANFEDDMTIAYDSEGRLLKANFKGNRVKFSLAEIEPIHAIQLEIVLRHYLKAVGKSIEVDAASDLAAVVSIFDLKLS